MLTNNKILYNVHHCPSYFKMLLEKSNLKLIFLVNKKACVSGRIFRKVKGCSNRYSVGFALFIYVDFNIMMISSTTHLSSIVLFNININCCALFKFISTFHFLLLKLTTSSLLFIFHLILPTHFNLVLYILLGVELALLFC